MEGASCSVRKRHGVIKECRSVYVEDGVLGKVRMEEVVEGEGQMVGRGRE